MFVSGNGLSWLKGVTAPPRRSLVIWPWVISYAWRSRIVETKRPNRENLRKYLVKTILQVPKIGRNQAQVKEAVETSVKFAEESPFPPSLESALWKIFTQTKEKEIKMETKTMSFRDTIILICLRNVADENVFLMGGRRPVSSEETSRLCWNAKNLNQNASVTVRFLKLPSLEQQQRRRQDSVNCRYDLHGFLYYCHGQYRQPNR